MRSREYSVALAVLAAASLLVLVSYSATWETLVVPVFAGTAGSPTAGLALTGRDLAPLGAAAGLVGLAGVGGIVATGTWGRRLVGGVLVLAGGAAGVSALAFGLTGTAFVESALLARGIEPGPTLDGTSSAWWLAALAGGLAMTAVGFAAVLRGDDWPGLSGRYRRREPAAAEGARESAPDGRHRTPEEADGAASPVSGIAAWDALDRGEDPTVNRSAGDGAGDGTGSMGAVPNSEEDR